MRINNDWSLTDEQLLQLTHMSLVVTIETMEMSAHPYKEFSTTVVGCMLSLKTILSNIL